MDYSTEYWDVFDKYTAQLRRLKDLIVRMESLSCRIRSPGRVFAEMILKPLKKLSKNSVFYCCSGKSKGVDQLASTVLEKKKKNGSNIKSRDVAF